MEKFEITQHVEKCQISPHLSCGKIGNYSECGEISDFSTSVMHINLKFLHMTNFSPHISFVIFATNMRYDDGYDDDGDDDKGDGDEGDADC